MRHAMVLSLASFVLHFAWENVQCPLLYVHGSYDASWRGIVRATSGDVLLTWMIYASVAVGSGRWRWDGEAWSARRWAVLIAAAIVIGLAVEVQALATGRWTYTPSMPVAPGLRRRFEALWADVAHFLVGDALTQPKRRRAAGRPRANSRDGPNPRRVPGSG